MSTFDIEISYKWDRDTYIRGSKSLYDDLLRHSPKRFTGWLFIALSQFGLVAFFKKGAFGLLFISTIFLIYWYILRWPIRKFLLLKSFEKSPLKDKIFTVAINKKGLKINDIDILWSDISRVLLEDDGFLLYYEGNFLFIPKEAFSEDNYKDFLLILKKYTSVEIMDDRRKK